MASAAVAGLIVVAVVSGCSTPKSGQAQAFTSSSAATSTASGPSQAPRVTHPLDATAFVNNPCSALTAADLAGLHIVNPSNTGAHPDAGGTVCAWVGDSGPGLTVSWLTANTNGLSDLYVKSNTIAYWQPLLVSGYPAAYGDVLTDGRAHGNCVLNVGVTDHLYFTVEGGNPLNAGQACSVVKQAAADVIKNLGGS